MIKNRQESIKNLFADLDLDFIPNPLTRDITIKKDSEAIKRSIRNLVLTELYERPFQPELNGGIRSILFERFGSVELATLQTRLEDVIANFEPRVIEVGVEIEEFEERHAIVINIRFRTSNISELQEINIQLQRLR